MPKNFDFYFDVISPYSYLAATQLDALCARSGATATWRPFFLGGVMQATDNKPPMTVFVPPKLTWFKQDMQDWAQYYGVKLSLPSSGFPFNSLRAQRLLVAAGEHGKTRELALSLFDSIWVRGESESVQDPSQLAALADAHGLDGAKLVAQSETPECKAELKAITDHAVTLGAFGAPSFVYDGRLYWGNDRMVLLEAALSRAKGL